MAHATYILEGSMKAVFVTWGHVPPRQPLCTAAGGVGTGVGASCPEAAPWKLKRQNQFLHTDQRQIQNSLSERLYQHLTC